VQHSKTDRATQETIPTHSYMQESLLYVPRSVYRPHSRSTKPLSAQTTTWTNRLTRVPPIPNWLCRLQLRSPGRGDTLPGKSV